MLSLPHGRVLLVVGWLLVLLTVAGSLLPTLPKVSGVPGDKVLHFVAYFGMTIWFAGLYPLRRLWIIAGGFVLLGGLLEILQGALLPHREISGYDFLANSAGIASACLLAVIGLSRWAVRLEAWVTRRAVVNRP